MEPNSPGGHGGGATGGGASSNITQLGGNAISTGTGTTDAGTIRTTIATDVTMTVAGAVTATGSVTALAGSAIIGKVGIDQTTDGTTNAVHLLAGTAVAGKFGIDQTTPGTTNAVQIAPASGTGWILDSYLIANNTTAVVVKSGACLVGKVELLNNSAVLAYLKLYDATSATAGSGTPKYRGIFFAPAAGGGGGMVSPETVGAKMATGATFIVTTGIADNDTGVPAASAYILNIWHT